jgi:hypothetical protein
MRPWRINAGEGRAGEMGDGILLQSLVPEACGTSRA